MKILISLIGGQPAPVYIGCLSENPDLNIFLTSPDTLKQAERLKNALKTYDIIIRETDPFDYDSCYKLIRDIVAEFPSDNFNLNFTSGTKVMSIAGFTAFRDAGFPMIYVDSQNGNILKFDEGGNFSLVREDIRISISNYFSIYGHSVEFDEKASGLSTQEKSDAVDFMSNHFVHVKLIYSELNKQLKDKSKTFFQIRDPHSGSELRYNSKKSTGKLIIRLGRTNPEFNITSSNMFGYLSGGWYEDYVASELVKLKSFSEVKQNAKLFVDFEGQREFRNEFDILAIKSNTLYIFECKTGNLDKMIIDKLRLIRSISGTYSRIFLVTLYSPTERNYMERVKDFNITLITKNVLADFLSSLSKQFSSNPNP